MSSVISIQWHHILHATARHQAHRNRKQASFRTWSLSAFARRGKGQKISSECSANSGRIFLPLIMHRYPNGSSSSLRLPNDNDVNICSVFQAITARPPAFAMWKHSPCRSVRPTWSSSRWSWAAVGSLRRTSTRRSGWSFPPITAWLGILSKRWEHQNIL